MIDTAWLDITRDPTVYGIDDMDLLVFGDWGYGSEDDPYGATGQYGDIRLEKKLHGDDDIIRVGEGAGAVGSQTTSARVWAGDGDDEIDITEGWYGHEIFGGRGDDTITFGGSYAGSAGTSTLNGGLGDDIFRAGADFSATNNDSNTLTINGGAGKNKYEGFPGAATLNINGGDDDEVIVVGADVGTGTINAGAGNDIVYGSGDADGASPGSITLSAFLDSGDDRFYGGESGLTESVYGGDGND